MNQQERDRKIAELETLLNDPGIRMDPERIWSLLAEVSGGLGPMPPLPLPPKVEPA